MAKRGRKPGPKKPKNDKPPGRTSWVKGTKLTFLDSRRETWQRAVDAGPVKAGVFYSNVTKLFLKKYGYNLPLDEDLEVDVEDPPDECIDDEDPEQEDMDEEEAERRSDIYTTTRTKIGQWYRHKYRKLLKRDKRSDMLNSLFENIANFTPKPPRKLRVEQFYSKKYYASRIKARFEADWERAQEDWKVVEGNGNPDNLRAPSRINVRNQATKAAYEMETDEFKKDVEIWLETERAAKLRAFEAKKEEAPRGTPEQFHQILADMGYYLQPFADIISKKFHSAVALFVTGPFGENGEIEVRSVHAGRTRDLLQEKWHENDPEAMTMIGNAMTKFAHKVFPPEMRAGRGVHDPSLAYEGLYKFNEDSEMFDGTTPRGSANSATISTAAPSPSSRTSPSPSPSGHSVSTVVPPAIPTAAAVTAPVIPPVVPTAPAVAAAVPPVVPAVAGATVPSIVPAPPATAAPTAPVVPPIVPVSPIDDGAVVPPVVAPAAAAVPPVVSVAPVAAGAVTAPPAHVLPTAAGAVVLSPPVPTAVPPVIPAAGALANPDDMGGASTANTMTTDEAPAVNRTPTPDAAPFPAATPRVATHFNFDEGPDHALPEGNNRGDSPDRGPAPARDLQKTTWDFGVDLDFDGADEDGDEDGEDQDNEDEDWEKTPAKAIAKEFKKRKKDVMKHAGVSLQATRGSNASNKYSMWHAFHHPKTSGTRNDYMSMVTAKYKKLIAGKSGKALDEVLRLILEWCKEYEAGNIGTSHKGAGTMMREAVQQFNNLARTYELHDVVVVGAIVSTSEDGDASHSGSLFGTNAVLLKFIAENKINVRVFLDFLRNCIVCNEYSLEGVNLPLLGGMVAQSDGKGKGKSVAKEGKDGQNRNTLRHRAADMMLVLIRSFLPNQHQSR
ncbi:hypothetical protein PLICRDRAFT_180780 [Plicaturopsis crispa FD-325 SS-3]|uniref:Uncharacterized protein n=1 Tax=Plicaturopsis crispa FD-325 SS-3 TaxID=944288 RepID=A0A0C9SPW4_PLICR|nr:hypothetical protein PLICRDRAFT_180780 [Plicaturopsis crispa FD-325 SS-3]